LASGLPIISQSSDKEWISFHAFQGEFARLFGLKDGEFHLKWANWKEKEDSPDYHAYHLSLEKENKQKLGISNIRGILMIEKKVWLWNVNLAWELFSNGIYNYRKSLLDAKEYKKHSHYKNVIFNMVTAVEAYCMRFLLKRKTGMKKLLK